MFRNCGEIGPSIIVKMVVEPATNRDLSSDTFIIYDDQTGLLEFLEKQRMQLNRCDRENGGSPWVVAEPFFHTNAYSTRSSII